MARGKGKKGINRGSGRRFAAESAEEIEQRNARLAQFDADRSARRKAEEGGDDDDDDDRLQAEREAMEIGRRLKSSKIQDDGDDDGYEKERKSKGTEGIINVENPNRARVEVSEGGMSRREREEAEKAAAAAAYRRKHEMGLTEEYKRDMAKLAEVRARREAAEAKAKAEKEAAEAAEKERRKKAEAVGAIDDSDEEDGKKKKSKKKGEDSIPKLDKITIKKMKPTQLKEALKVRGLDIQGNSKQLTERLLEYEKNR